MNTKTTILHGEGFTKWRVDRKSALVEMVLLEDKSGLQPKEFTTILLPIEEIFQELVQYFNNKFVWLPMFQRKEVGWGFQPLRLLNALEECGALARLDEILETNIGRKVKLKSDGVDMTGFASVNTHKNSVTPP